MTDLMELVLNLDMDTSNKEVYPPISTTYHTAVVACELTKPGHRVLEVGTGSGLIAIAVAKVVPEATVVASDINEKAIKVAAANAQQNDVKIQLIRSELFAEFGEDQFDVVVAHPPAVPYLPGHSWKMTDGMRVATNGGPDGSDLVRRMIVETKRCLRQDGVLVLGLPHWSNVQRAFETLEREGWAYEIAREAVAVFFPMRRPDQDVEAVEHVQKLTREGSIEIDFSQKTPVAPVSIVVAWEEVGRSRT